MLLQPLGHLSFIKFSSENYFIGAKIPNIVAHCKKIATIRDHFWCLYKISYIGIPHEQKIAPKNLTRTAQLAHIAQNAKEETYMPTAPIALTVQNRHKYQGMRIKDISKTNKISRASLYPYIRLSDAKQ